MADDRPLADKPSVIEIRTPDGTKVFRAEKPTSAFGVVSADFELADQVKLGTYSIDVTTTVTPAVPASGDGGAAQPAVTVHGARQVEVKRYALPKLKLALEDVAAFAPDGPLKGAARATWIFGEPVTKGKVRVWLERNGSTLRDAKGEPDKDGVLRFELRPGAGKPDQQPRGTFTLHARVDLEGGLFAEAKQTVSTLKSDLKLEAFPESGVLVRDVEQTVYVVVTEAADRAGITVRALPDGIAAKTSERGIAAVRVRPDIKASNVELAAYAEDGSEGKLVVPVGDALVVAPDKASYAAGETARVKVLGAGHGDRIAVRMTKGSEPVALGSCTVASGACEATLAIPAATSGLVWAHALSLPTDKKREVRSGKRLVLAGGGSRDLGLAVTSDKKVFAPREVGAIDVAVTAAGAPVLAQLGIAVADEAVFALADVRPDLEKIFFTVDRDLDATQKSYYGAYSYRSQSSQHALPAGYEAANAYDPTTADEVRRTILAALTTMPELGAAQGGSSSEVKERARGAVETALRKLGAWCILAIATFSLFAFACFGAYGVVRWKRPLLLATGADDDTTTLRLETRALFVDYLTAIFAPPLLAAAGFALGEMFSDGGSSNGDRAISGAWLVLGIFSAVLLVRTSMRVRRAVAARDATTMRRVLFFLPLAIFFAHLTALLLIADRGRRIALVIGTTTDVMFVAFALIAAAQVTAGLLSVVRQTQLRAVTPRGRIWLFASRATFFGLPLTLAGFGVATWAHHKWKKGIDWSEYYEEEQVAPAATASNADNKEGGTGTRAKGEEGSMGNPSPKAAGARFGVMGPRDDALAPGQPPVHVRDYFPETLLWAPDVVTDEQGHARIHVPFADSITTWRFGVKAVSKAGQLGSTTVPLVVKQDFFVDTLLPPTLTQGDEIAVPVTVFSYTDGAQDVALEIEGDGVTVTPSKLALHLAKGEARGVRFAIKAEKAGDRTVRLRATSASRADAMEKKILVVPNGQQMVRAINARASGSGKSTIDFPANAIDGGNDLYVKIYGGPLSQLAEGLDGVFTMPHGCFEQTSSTTYPSVLALQFLERTKAASPEVEKKARGYIAMGYQRLISFEVSGGGFSLFGKSPAATVLTAYGLLELADMARVATVDERVVERTREWLLRKRTPTGGWTKGAIDAREASDPKDDVLVTAYVAWALAASLDGKTDATLASVLDVVATASGHDADDPYALALRSNALLAGGRKDDARPLLERLARQAVRGDDGAHFTSKATGVMYSYGASMDVEVTGLASHALALASMEPELRSAALDWLVSKKGARGTWSTTQATIAAMRALLDDARPITKAPQEIKVLVDGETTEAFTLEPAARDVHRLVSLRKYATTGKRFVEVRASGDGDVSYQLVAIHYLPWLKSKDAGLALDVAYAPNAVDAGSALACHVKLGWRGKEAARMPLVEIGVPPAFEVDGDELDALLKNSAVQRYTIDRGKVTLYLVSLAEDKPMAIDLHMRALRPARVVVPSSSAYLYYEPEVRAETAPTQVRAL